MTGQKIYGRKLFRDKRGEGVEGRGWKEMPGAGLNPTSKLLKAIAPPKRGERGGKIWGSRGGGKLLCQTGT